MYRQTACCALRQRLLPSLLDHKSICVRLFHSFIRSQLSFSSLCCTHAAAFVAADVGGNVETLDGHFRAAIHGASFRLAPHYSRSAYGMVRADELPVSLRQPHEHEIRWIQNRNSAGDDQPTLYAVEALSPMNGPANPFSPSVPCPRGKKRAGPRPQIAHRSPPQRNSPPLVETTEERRW